MLAQIACAFQNALLGKIATQPEGRVDRKALQPEDAASENAFAYGRLVSGQSIYAYVGGNPLTDTDPKGLVQIGRPNAVARPTPCLCPPVPPTPAGASCDQNMDQASKNLLNSKWFYNQTRNNAPWDYKQQGNQFEQFGNFNFGATGIALGIPTNVLLRGAGWAQGQAGTSQSQWGNWYGAAPYGDDPADQAAIAAGIQYAICGCNKRGP